MQSNINKTDLELALACSEGDRQAQRALFAEIYDITGRLMRVHEKGNWNQQSLDVADLPPGIYLMNMMDKSGRVLITQRFYKN